MTLFTRTRGLGLITALAVAGSAGACSTVSPEEMDSSLAELRSEMLQEMEEGDESVRSDLSADIDAVEARLDQLEQDLQQMEEVFEVAIAELEDQLRFNVPVYFGFDESEIQSRDQAVLDRFASVANEYYPDAQITVEGFTDPAGDESYNMWLGEQRAQAVANYLVEFTAMDEGRVRAVSYGEDTNRLITDAWGPGTEGWQNRRVVLVIDHNGQTPAMVSGPEQGSDDLN
ncbi:MAG: OmpA family protein [Longimicrobiales bacterium]|nr:OmpA family protein [Longimicrobiales bacterium]